MKAFWRGLAEWATAVFSFLAVFAPVFLGLSQPEVMTAIVRVVGEPWAALTGDVLLVVITLAAYWPLRVMLWRMVRSRWLSGLD